MDANGQHEAGEEPKDRADSLPPNLRPDEEPLGPLERKVELDGTVYWPKPPWFKPQERLPDTHEYYPGVLRCKKWCGRKGRQCRLPVASQHADWMLCNKHGKAARLAGPSGAAHHNWKTGAFSKHMRPSVKAFYRSALYDPNALSLLTEIGLAEARAYELYESLPSEGGLGVWEQCKSVWADVKKAQRNNDPNALGEAMRNLERVITKGVDCEHTHKKLRQAWDAKAKLVSVEITSKQVKNNYMPREAVIQLLSMIWSNGVESIRESLVEAFASNGEAAIEVAKKLEGTILKSWASKVGPMFPAATPTTPQLPAPTAQKMNGVVHD